MQLWCRPDKTLDNPIGSSGMRIVPKNVLYQAKMARLLYPCLIYSPQKGHDLTQGSSQLLRKTLKGWHLEAVYGAEQQVITWRRIWAVQLCVHHTQEFINDIDNRLFREKFLEFDWSKDNLAISRTQVLVENQWEIVLCPIHVQKGHSEDLRSEVKPKTRNLGGQEPEKIKIQINMRAMNGCQLFGTLVSQKASRLDIGLIR